MKQFDRIFRLEKLIDLRQQADSAHLLNLLPKKVWNIVTNQLINKNKHATLTALSNTSLFFRNITLRYRTFFLFPTVGLHLAGYCHQDFCELLNCQEKIQSKRNGNCEENDHQKTESLTFSELLKLRLVCQLWCRTIDHYHQNIFPSSVLIKDKPFCGNIMLIVDKLEVPKDYKKFIAHFALTHTNTGRSPFIGNAVSLEYHHNGINPLEEPIIIKFLSLYGSQIRYISLSKSHELYDHRKNDRAYLELRRILTLIPNALVLELDIQISPYRDGNEVLQEIRDNPLPHLEQLKVFRFLEPTPAISNSLIRSNTHIGIISFGDFHPEEPLYHGPFYVPSNDLYWVTLPNLRELSVRSVSFGDFERLLKPIATWPLLVKLSVSIHFPMWRSHLFGCTQHIFDVICGNNRGNTLTELEINFSKVWSMMTPNRFRTFAQFYDTVSRIRLNRLRLNAWNLKKFTIYMLPPLPLDFLLPAARNLETLIIMFDSRLKHPDYYDLFALVDRKSRVKFWEFYINSENRPTLWNYFKSMQLVNVFPRHD